MALYDVVIAGAGPAGATAAALLARNKRSVALVDQRSFPSEGAHVAWLNALAQPLLEEIEVRPKRALGEPFNDVTFHNAELDKSARPKLDRAPGHLVVRETFDHSLVKAATGAGAALCERWEVADAQLHEDGVELTHTGGESICGRMLLVATGPDSPLIERLLPTARLGAGGRWTARADRKLGRSAKTKPSVAIVLGLTRQGGFGLAMVSGSHVAVAVSTPGAGDEVTELLTSLCQRLASKQVVPVDLSVEAASAIVCHVPAGTALDLDSHVGKHALVIGDAGGFVAAASDEGIYPAMWSAQIATEVMHVAMDSMHSQDVLMEFDSKWRMAMAEYLRPPNTDTQFLIPLIFSNQPMADRMAAAFFAGENI